MVVRLFTSHDVNLFRTKTIKNNGYNPIWNEIFKFEVSEPDVSHFHFSVYDEEGLSGSFVIGYSSLSVNCLSAGFGVLNLFDEKGVRQGIYQFASLFICTLVE